jgi:hypothetical protein
MKIKLPVVVILTIILNIAPYASGKDFYVDPQNGSMDNDGSAVKPWRTFQEVLTQGLIESQEPVSLP